MKVYSISNLHPVTTTKQKSYLSKEKVESSCANSDCILFAYKDFNISFSGRTPEDFYAQDFNRENMPNTMKDYLNYDYDTRQHIPPEQMMREVFKYVKIADNFADVKSIYPNEDLFKNLHENNVKARKTILSEINVARELGESSLLKNGEDNFGMYLLRKIYLDGKTLKEINKDFFERDISDEYKGIITEPIKYDTLNAYGISYPKGAFWHSFINTRDEYRKFFVTLPKNSVIPGVNVSGNNSGTHHVSKPDSNVSSEKPQNRRYNLKPHRKREIQRDIISKKGGDIESIKKTVVRRFGKDDPEASFIVKYMSPIMTVAADRAHLSEELKSFAEFERENGKMPNGKTMFERFWKYNPKILEVYSAAITDTIDMFEDIYGEGGLIAINADLEKITKSSENQKAIDYVSSEFLDLLSYAQQIEQKRNDMYLQHDRLQQQWENHFLERYGVANADDNASVDEFDETKNSDEVVKLANALSFYDKLVEEVNKNNAKVYQLKTIDGSNIYIASDLDEVLRNELKLRAQYLPAKYAEKYIKETMSDNISDKFKLTLAALKTGKIFDDMQLMNEKEFKDTYEKLYDYHYNHYLEERASRMAMLDSMFTENKLNIYEPEFYKISAFNINESFTSGSDDDVNEFKAVMKSLKKNINAKFDAYTTPTTPSETAKIQQKIINYIMRYNPDKTYIDNKDTVEVITMLKDSISNPKNKSIFSLFLRGLIEASPYFKSILQKGLSNEVDNAKLDIITDDIVQILLASIENNPGMITVFNNDAYSAHKSNLPIEIRLAFEKVINMLNYDCKKIFFLEKNNAYYDKFLFDINFD